MDWTIIVDALVALLVAGSVGLIAYGGWTCVRHAISADGAAEPAERMPADASQHDGGPGHPRVMLD